MTSLPDGHSGTTESQRQVLVVEEDPARRQRLCALLARQGLAVHCARTAEATRTAQGWPGLIVIGTTSARVTGRHLAHRLRAGNARGPIILLDADDSEGRLRKEIDRWVKATPPRREERHGEVLLVEDEPKVRSLVQNFLEFKGFTVIAASSGEEALERLACSSPGVVLLDIKLPGMDGLSTLKRLRVSHPTLPVIFLTQVDEDHAKEEARTLGAHEYLTKPFDFEYLETLLRTQVFTEEERG